MRRLGLLLTLTLAFLTGCSRARVTTEIHPNGTFTRTLALTGQDKKNNPGAMGDTLEDDFLLPSSPRWTTHTDTEAASITTTFERNFAAGESSDGDLTLKGEKNSTTLINQVSVKRLTPHHYEYRETLRWTGAPLGGMDTKPEDLIKLKSVLPPALATDENVRDLSQKMEELAMPMFFGPGDPILTIGFFHPDLAGRRMNQKIGSVMLTALQQQFGDKLTQDQRRDITLKMIAMLLARSKQTAPSPNAGPSTPGQGAGFTPLMFVLKTPGKIASTNGETDELTGEVFWALYPPAAALKPVVMTATVDIN